MKVDTPLLMRLFCLLLLCCSFLNQGKANNRFTTNDSLFMIAESDYRLYLQHKVGPAETKQSLANLYNMSIKELESVNWSLRDKALMEGQFLKIPLDTACIIRNPIQVNDYPFCSAIYYSVKQGETLYTISKKRLGLHPNDLMAWNELQDATLSPGQKLIVGWFSIDYYRTHKKEILQREFTIINKHLVDAYKNQKNRGHEKIVAGAAQRIDGVKSNGGVVMHRKAKIGSVISIINPMTKHVAFAKVVGRVPASYDPSIQVLIPVVLAEQLGALDDKFFVRTRYF